MKNSELKKIVTNKQYHLLILLFIFSVFVTLIETIGLGSTAIFVIILTDANSVIEKIPFEFLKTFLENQSYLSLITISALTLTSFFLIKNLIIVLYTIYELHLRKQLINYNRVKFYKGYLQADYMFHLKNNSSQFITNIMLLTAQSATYIIFLAKGFKDILLIIFLIITLLFVSTQLSLTLIVLLGTVSFFIYYIIKTRIQKIAQETIRLDTYLLKNLNHGIGSFKTIKILGIENFFLKDFSEKDNQRLQFDLNNRFLQTLPRLFLEVLGILFLTLTIIFLLNDGNTIKDVLPTITLITVVIVRVVPVAVNLNAVFSNLKYFGESFKKMSKEFDRLEIQIKKNYSHNDDILFKKSKSIKSLEIKNLSFGYTQDKIILNDLSIKVESGDLIGIVGKSGSGKTTLVDIILGLLHPSKGQILINNDDINNKINLYKKKISYVPQDIFLIDDTIKKNIAFGIDDKDIDQQKISEVLEYVKLSDYINELPNKTETIVGERGTRLSGGQKQRVGIARALYNDADLIVLDESTNALDFDTEEKIIKDINELKENRIIIFITHRVDSLKKCDKILSLSKGKLMTHNSYENYKSS